MPTAPSLDASMPPIERGAVVAPAELLRSGAIDVIGIYAPFTTDLSPQRPASIVNEPPKPPGASRLYGEFPFGVSDKPVGIIVDELPDRSATIIADTNRDKQLDNDERVVLGGSQQVSRDGKISFVRYKGGIPVQLEPDVGSPVVQLRITGLDAASRAIVNATGFDRAADYALVGTAQFGGKDYRFLIENGSVTGRFCDSAGHPAEDLSLLLDVNQNGILEQQIERFAVDSPFDLGGGSFELSYISLKDGRVVFTPSRASVTARAPGQVIRTGDIAPGFDAPLTWKDGAQIPAGGAEQSVKFPDAFKGKLVLLDFWASWCGFCLDELPFQKAAYERFHGQGLEILSVSIDTRESVAKYNRVIHESGLPWLHVLDSGGGAGEIVSRYAPNGIPALYLINGNTGEVIASGNELRGAKLDSAIAVGLQKVLPQR